MSQIDFAVDVVVVGATPAGIAAALAAARMGCDVLLLERTSHIGGLIANGLGATDLLTRGAAGGLFAEFTGHVRRHYETTYGPDSPQVQDCGDGYYFEPSVAGRVLGEMLEEQSLITVLLMRQFDALPENAVREGTRLAEIRVLNRATQGIERVRGGVFIDATYEGDLAAAAGAPYRLGREDRREFNEPLAGQVYKVWDGDIAPGTTGLGDNAIQAYNFRLPLTRDPANRVPISRPESYRREEYVSLIDDLLTDCHAGKPGVPHEEMEWDGIGRVVNMVRIPNGKTDANNQHKALLSTDLPEENWPWPTASWDWRDRFARRLRDYTLGLLWFCQNDPELPAGFRARCAKWGLARDEYQDNGHFPRQVYVREGRRIKGEYVFTAHDALPAADGRPPIHADSIASSHYNLDSHAVRKREPGRRALDGMLSLDASAFTVPYGVIVPRAVDGLLVPVAASATHIGFSTLRMEPCWMALGEAAGAAAGLSLAQLVPPRDIDVPTLQLELIRHDAVLVYFRDITPGHPHYTAIQMLGSRGLLPAWEARPDDPVSASDAKRWRQAMDLPGGKTPSLTRGGLLDDLWRQSVHKLNGAEEQPAALARRGIPALPA